MKTPKEILKEIEEGKNEIQRFWSVRGYNVVKHCLGMDITFHRENPRYECLGLSLQYLEQFRDEIIKNYKEKRKLDQESKRKES